jgi:hypothetical protein
MPTSSLGAHAAAAAIRYVARDSNAGRAPLLERGLILDDGRLQPLSWSGEPFWPAGSTPLGEMGFERAWHLAEGQTWPPALEGDLQHSHATRALAAGDRVLLCWAMGVPVVLEILA